MDNSVSTFINPLTDLGFKYIFGRNDDTEIPLMDKSAEECDTILDNDFIY